MKLLFSYLKPYGQVVFLVLLLGGVSQVFAMLDPHFMGIIIDKLVIRPHHEVTHNGKREFVIDQSRNQTAFIFGILKYLFLIIGATTISRIAKVGQDYSVSLLVKKIGSKLFSDGLTRTLQLPYEEFENQSSGEVLNILQKVRIDTEQLMSAFIYLLFSTFVAFVFVIVYSYSIHWMIIPVYFAGVAAIALLSGVLSSKIRTTQRLLLNETSSLAGSTTESIRNIELIKTSGLTGQQIDRLDGRVQDILALELSKIKKVRVLSFIQGGSIVFFRQILMFVLLWLIFRNEITPGQLLTLSFYSYFIFNPLYDIGKISLFYREAKISLHELDKIFHRSVNVSKPSAVHIGVIDSIKFSHISFRYQTGVSNALADVSFEIVNGQTVAFVGPSGSGKTTLIKLLTGLYQTQEGDILFNDISNGAIDLEDLRRGIGFVGQDAQLFAGTIRENLLFANPTANDEQIMTALERASCSTLLNRANNGVDTVIGEGGIKISRGERQRISIARALIRNPQLVIFDEATSSMDSLSEEQITDTIRRLSAQKLQITMLVTHRLSTILHADVIYVLEKGHIVETGTHESLITEGGLYYAMWRQQIGERRGQVAPD